MGFHTRGEMGGIWSPPIKLVDGVWFGIDDQWIGPATRFSSGYGSVRMDLPDTGGVRVARTDFVPGERRGVLIRLRLSNPGARTQRVRLMMDAHSELMSIYPWGETKPYTQKEFNLRDDVAFRDRTLTFTERGTPPLANVEPHDWAAAVGSSLKPIGTARARAIAGRRSRP